MSVHLFFHKLQSPIGEITLVENSGKLCALLFSNQWSSYKKENLIKKNKMVEKKTTLLLKAERQLKSYFSGKKTQFSIPLELNGTSFQKTVWSQLLEIPYGKKISYSEQAEKVGKIQAVRAVGSANGKNPIPLIVPCHRVISKSGSLGGYSGGLKVKELLLKLEANS